MTSTASKCPTCGAPAEHPYCPHCGEKRIDHHDLSLKHFAEHTVEAFTHADGKIFGTLRSLVVTPGQLTADYVNGRRKPNLGPLQLFLICNVFYFLVHPLLRWDSLSSTLYTNMNLSWFRSIAKPMVETKLSATHATIEAYSEKFDHESVLHGKSLVILLVPLFTILFAVMLWKQRRPLVMHIVFALHFAAFFLLGLIVTHAWLNLIQYACRAFGSPLSNNALDIGSGVTVLLIYAFYLRSALKRAYGLTGGSLAAGVVVATAATLPIITIYRFVLFLITLRST